MRSEDMTASNGLIGGRGLLYNLDRKMENVTKIFSFLSKSQIIVLLQ